MRGRGYSRGRGGAGGVTRMMPGARTGGGAGCQAGGHLGYDSGARDGGAVVGVVWGDLGGAKCTCTGVGKQVDGDHAHTCKISGRASAHNAVRQRYGGAATRWNRTEVRGGNYYCLKGDKRGPDIGATMHGVPTFLTSLAWPPCLRHTSSNFELPTKR